MAFRYFFVGLLTRQAKCGILCSARGVLNGGIDVKDERPELICDEMSQTIIDTAEKIAISSGAESVTVRRILQALGITNRVFYNRFRNVDEVLYIAYRNTALKARAGIVSDFDPEGDFLGQLVDIGVNTLIMCYENRMKFNQYVFDTDSRSGENCDWWKAEIKKLIRFGQSEGHFKDVDADIMSHAIWCFVRGYIADVLGHKIPKDQAAEGFRYSFGVFLNGMKP
jgi:AcrR family transcriptional regulator